MVRASRLVGLPVVSLERAAKVGITKEVWLSSDLRSVDGFLVDLRRFLASVRFLPFSALFSLAPSLLTIRNETVLEAVKEADLDGVGIQAVISSIVRTSGGDVVGSLSDLFVNENTGRVLEFEVSEGVIQDITKGRTRISPTECTSFSGSTITLMERAPNQHDTRE